MTGGCHLWEIRLGCSHSWDQQKQKQKTGGHTHTHLILGLDLEVEVEVLDTDLLRIMIIIDVHRWSIRVATKAVHLDLEQVQFQKRWMSL